jgi:hypothetical protein
MKDLFRTARDAAGDLVGKAQRLIPGGKSDVDDPSEDEDDDDLPEVDVTDPAHVDLARLDEEDADPIVIENDSLFDDLRQIDPTPEDRRQRRGCYRRLDRGPRSSESETVTSIPPNRRDMPLNTATPATVASEPSTTTMGPMTAVILRISGPFSW